MIKLDSKDKKILYLLSLDSRQSINTIAKKSRTSKEFAAYRIKRLFKNEIISKYRIYTNSDKLGYITVIFYYNFKKINPIIKNKIIEFFIENEYISYVSEIDGTYDLQVDFLIGDPFDYESLMDNIKKKFHKYLEFKFSTTYIRLEEYNYPFLLNDKKNIIQPRIYAWGTRRYIIDDLDLKILSELSKNPRKQTKVIANNLNITVSIVHYRVKKMINENIIDQFSIQINWLKLGYRFFHLRVYLSKYENKNLILDHIRKNPYLIRITKDLIYSVDIHCTFLLQNMNQFRKIIEDLTLRFPDEIDKCEFYSTYKIYKHEKLIPKLINIENPERRSKL